MKLYDVHQAPNCRRVHVFMAEKGIEVPKIPVDYSAREYRSENFQAKNPFMLVPALELDDGRVLSESVSICRYLEMLHPEPNLFGTSEEEKVLIEMWNRRAEIGFFFPVAQAFRHLHPYMKDHEIPQIEDWGKSCREKALAVLPAFDAELRGREFLAADRITIADITLLIATEFMRPARIDIPDTAPHFRAWYDRVSARPAAAESK